MRFPDNFRFVFLSHIQGDELRPLSRPSRSGSAPFGSQQALRVVQGWQLGRRTDDQEDEMRSLQGHVCWKVRFKTIPGHI